MDLQEIINDIDKRLKALEHTVNEVIIDGLKRATTAISMMSGTRCSRTPTAR